MVTIKSKSEIEKMKVAGKVTYGALKAVHDAIHPGVSTLELDRVAERYIKSQGCTCSFKGYAGFPGSICASVNDEIIHGIPDHRILHEGDIISIDVGACYHGYNGDACRTFGVGKISEEAERLIRVTRQSFFEGIKYAKAGNHLYDISAAIQKYAESFGFGVVRDLVGHGIGTDMHEEPEIPNFAQKRKGIKLAAGMTLAIEPMITAGRYDVAWMDDGWTVVTEDGSLASHYENTILITDGEPEILSL